MVFYYKFLTALVYVISVSLLLSSPTIYIRERSFAVKNLNSDRFIAPKDKN
jgi:hypothetical protein